ncbi:MAG: hypothetical protein MUP98_02905 [Candidatus Aminicenantes bacterium]|nr:hypothetical protein [Candidatus Aminicenantes bacterium]
MKLKNIRVLVLIFGLIFGTLSISSLNAQVQDPSQVVEALAREFIPSQILSILKSGLDTRTANTGIPFDIFKSLYLPAAQQYMHGVFFFKCKNSDLDFQGAAKPAAEEVSAFESTPTQLISRNNIYLYFKQLDGDYEKQTQVPFNQKADGLTFTPEEEVYYSIGYPLPPGDYVLAMAISSPDYSKVGTQYYEFSLPSAAAFTEIDISPVFFVTKSSQISAVEMSAEVHKSFFTYGIYQLEPNLNHLFSPGDNMDLFFVIFGTQANAEGKYDIEIKLSINQGEQIVALYDPLSKDRPAFWEQFPMKRPVSVPTKDAEGNETENTEFHNLEPGAYTVTIEIKDLLSGKAATKTVEIEVR